MNDCRDTIRWFELEPAAARFSVYLPRVHTVRGSAIVAVAREMVRA